MRLGRRPAAPPAPEPELPEWEYVPEGWRRPAPGWNAESVLRLYERKWPAFLRALQAPNPLGVNHEAPPEEIERGDDSFAHNLLVTFAYVLALTAGTSDRISLLDWGGGIGHYYAVARTVLPELDVEYHCRDLPILAARGRQLFPDARFYDDDSCLARTYDLVFASSSLQYSERWQETLRALAGATARHLFVTRVPLARHAPSFVVLQRAQKHGYGTEYLGWVLNRGELLETAQAAGLELVREFLTCGRFSAPGAPEDPVGHAGFLFRPALH
jgi:putative methyltransferase (TIGR04325 family)